MIFLSLLLLLPRFAFSFPSKNVPSVWFDTDIDDTLALSYLVNEHKAGNVKLEGISTVTNIPQEKAAITKYLLQQWNASISVYTGIGNTEKNSKSFLEFSPAWPLSVFGYPYGPKNNYTEMYNRQGLAYKGLLDVNNSPDINEAVDALIETARRVFKESGRKLCSNDGTGT